MEKKKELNFRFCEFNLNRRLIVINLIEKYNHLENLFILGLN